MTVTISTYDSRTLGSWQSQESMTQSTATALQALSVKTDVSILGGGTATGTALRNIYSLAAGLEGQEKLLLMNATGEASVTMAFATTRYPFDVGFTLLGSTGGTATIGNVALTDSLVSATGMLVFQSDGDYALVKYFNAKWHVKDVAGATLATVT